MEKLPLYKLTIKEDTEAIQEVNAVALVDMPAIGENFFAFNKQLFVEPNKGEHESEFIPRCISYVVGEGKDQEQAAAICYDIWNTRQSHSSFAESDKVSLDYDGVLSTDKGKELAKRLISEGYIVYIISARQDVESMLANAESVGIPKDRIFATGSNKAKIEKINELGIYEHYDNNEDVINNLGSLGHKFESYTDYPKAASENAKIALRWAEENGWGSCGTPVGKARANQLANGEAISRDTIARMAAFERHRQNSQKELGDGCGRLMWLAWGGDDGIEWAQRKLKQIDAEKKFSFSVVNEEDRIVVGPAMIPDMKIYRKDETGEYYVFFDKKTIETIALKFYQKGFQQNANEMHAKAVDGVTFFQSWIADESKGIPKMKQFENLPDGTWFLGAKVNNDETWAKVKNGTFKGFSVEGMFDMTEIKMRQNADDIITKLRELLANI